MNAPIDRQPCRSGAGDHVAEGIRAPAPAEATYTWQPVADGIYAIAWRRTEGSTVAGQSPRRSRATPSPELDRLERSLRGL